LLCINMRSPCSLFWQSSKTSHHLLKLHHTSHKTHNRAGHHTFSSPSISVEHLATDHRSKPNGEREEFSFVSSPQVFAAANYRLLSSCAACFSEYLRFPCSLFLPDLKGPWKPGGLWSNAISVAVPRGLCGDGALGQHKATANDWSVVVSLLLTSVSRFAFFVILSQLLDCGCLLTHVTDHEWHGKVVETVSPRNLHDNVQRYEIVA
jgi:hypothetical protein